MAYPPPKGRVWAVVGAVRPLAFALAAKIDRIVVRLGHVYLSFVAVKRAPVATRALGLVFRQENSTFSGIGSPCRLK